MRLLNSSLLLVIFVALAAGNFLITAQRSLIPLDLDAEVLGLEMRREKHPGKDDVYLVSLSGLGTIQIDKEIAIQLKVGQQIQKERWARQLYLNGRVIPLEYSKDFLGMSKAMPLCILVAMGVLFWPQLWSVFIRRPIQ